HRRPHHREPDPPRTGLGAILAGRLQERHRRQCADRHRRRAVGGASASLHGGDQERPLGHRLDYRQRRWPHHPQGRQGSQPRRPKRRRRQRTIAAGRRAHRHHDRCEPCQQPQAAGKPAASGRGGGAPIGGRRQPHRRRHGRKQPRRRPAGPRAGPGLGLRPVDHRWLHRLGHLRHRPRAARLRRRRPPPRHRPTGGVRGRCPRSAPPHPSAPFQGRPPHRRQGVQPHGPIVSLRLEGRDQGWWGYPPPTPCWRLAPTRPLARHRQNSRRAPIDLDLPAPFLLAPSMALNPTLTSLPNLLTYGRIVAIPVIVALLVAGSGPLRWLALILYLTAAVSDFFDGYLARRWNQISPLGRMLDPIADKLLVGALIVAFAWDRSLAAWDLIPALAILLREIFVSGLREYLGPKNVIVKVSRLAKWKTTVQLLALTFIFLAPLLAGAGLVAELLLWLAGILTVITGAQY